MPKKTFWTRLGLLWKDPRHNIKKIVPYLQSKIFLIKKLVLETIGNDTLSKPYMGHDALLRYLPKKAGFFVEVGGNDGYFQDPTYYLEKFLGWQGLIAEPLPIADLCRKNRKNSLIINAAMVSFDFKEDKIAFIDCNAMSVVKKGVEGYEEWVKEGERCQKITARELEVPAKKLNDVLDDYFKSHPKKTIDLLAIDVEGYELDVLKGLNLDKYQPSYLLLEILRPEKAIDLEKHLDGKYKLLEIIGSNDYLYGLID